MKVKDATKSHEQIVLENNLPSERNIGRYNRIGNNEL